MEKGGDTAKEGGTMEGMEVRKAGVGEQSGPGTTYITAPITNDSGDGRPYGTSSGNGWHRWG